MDAASRGATYDLSRWVFLRGLGLVYAIAFVSLAVQLDGLIGDDGILPAADYLAAVDARLGAAGHWYVPTVAWALGASTSVLTGLVWTGAAASAALLLDLAPKLAALLAWVLYLSLVCVGQVFLEFQWDTLLLEAGLLGIVLAPWGARPGLGRRRSPRPLVWLCWLLVAKLNVLSGLVKLLSDDPTWWSLTALRYHYWTTCLPTWTGWWAHQLPDAVHRLSAAAMFAIELIVPVGILLGRRPRHVAASLLIALQVGIAATGNYGFFNLLTVVLCLSLYDDAALARAWPPLRRWEHPPAASPPCRLASAVLAGALAALSLLPAAARVGAADLVPAPLLAFHRLLAPLRSFNAYGLFANMTTTRPEIVVEGTLDGETWRPYGFRWKPGDLLRRPGFVEPHMPRLDWQMWFAALQGPRRAYWFRPFLERLLHASRPVLALLADDPFDGRRPRAIRALLYRYRFTDRAERRESGAWWRRELVGTYAGPLEARTPDPRRSAGRAREPQGAGPADVGRRASRRGRLPPGAHGG